MEVRDRELGQVGLAAGEAEIARLGLHDDGRVDLVVEHLGLHPVEVGDGALDARVQLLEGRLGVLDRHVLQAPDPVGVPRGRVAAGLDLVG